MNFFLAQLNPIVGDLDGNAKKILHIADKAYACSKLGIPKPRNEFG